MIYIKIFEHDICFRGNGLDDCEDGMDGYTNGEINLDNDGNKDSDKNAENERGNSVMKCGREMDNILMSEVNETEGRVLQLFQKFPNGGDLLPCPSPELSTTTFNTISTEEDVDSDVTDLSTDPPITSQSTSTDINMPVNIVEKKSSVYDMTKNIKNVSVVTVEPSDHDVSNESMSSKLCHKAITQVR